MTFLSYKSHKTLQALAQRPFDLTEKNALTPHRLEKYTLTTPHLKLVYATERVDDEVMHSLHELAKEAKVLEKMNKIQNGEVMNFIQGYESENRKVLHTAMRDVFDDVNTHPEAKEAAQLAKVELSKLEKFCHKIDQEKKIDTIVQVGIGGSDLGPRAVYLAMQAWQKKPYKVFFQSNVDPDDATAILKEIDLKKTLVVVVSKSGGTLETRTNEQFFRKAFEKEGIDPKNHLIAVTGKGSPMDNPERYLASFYIWDYIGGRYSVTSMVGAVTLSLALGIDVFKEFLRGAHEMDLHAKQEPIESNLPLTGALLGIWNRNFLNHPTCAIIPYSNAMIRFTAHLQQLDMESNGKHITQKGEMAQFSTGPIIWGEPGTNGQHSFYQLIHQGTDIIPLEFLGFEKSQYQHDVTVEHTTSQQKLLSNLFAQSIGLATGKLSDNPNKQFKGNRPNRILFAKQLTPHALGMILAYFEHKVAFQGLIWGINSFDQEGVQLGKVLANQIIDLFAKKNQKQPIPPGEFPLGQEYLKILLG